MPIKSSANIKSQVTSVPQCDSPRNCGDLDAYGLFIRSINTNMEYFGDFNEISITMELGSFNSGDAASSNIQNYERFLKDITKLNKIKKSEHPGVVELWGQLETLLVLIKETDK